MTTLIVDLRSDTVTRPTPGMRRAMADAEVGDDVYGEDPTAKRLEARVAELLGKEAALFVPSGTMGNQLALLVHCRPGDEVVVGHGAHVAWYEGGAGAAWAGVQFAVAEGDGTFGPDALEAAIKPSLYVHPRTTLCAVENTHNKAGGRVFPADLLAATAERARARGLGVHLDGARLWNAAVATGRSPAELAAPVDTVSVCFSKGLGAPVGSAFVGSRDHVAAAHRLRKMLGGGMRQVGVLCAAAGYALDHHRERLAEDHENARRLAAGVAALPGLRCDPQAVETNIVNVAVDGEARAPELAVAAARAGVLIGATGPSSLRLVTHLDVDGAAVDAAVEALGTAVDRG